MSWVTRSIKILLNSVSIVAGLDESWLFPLRLEMTHLYYYSRRWKTWTDYFQIKNYHKYFPR